MSFVEYSPEAEEDLLSIAEYIAQDKPDAAKRWIQKLRESCNLLASQPEMGEHRKDLGFEDCRSFSVGSYVIFFRKTSTGIQIARIIHGSRDLRN